MKSKRLSKIMRIADEYASERSTPVKTRDDDKVKRLRDQLRLAVVVVVREEILDDRAKVNQ